MFPVFVGFPFFVAGGDVTPPPPRPFDPPTFLLVGDFGDVASSLTFLGDTILLPLPLADFPFEFAIFLGDVAIAASLN